ncbi:MAG: DNA repair protein RecO C-terminal domain-containing protein [Hymenobacter sp.]
MREEEENLPLFRFLRGSILTFDEQEVGTENFALLFLPHLAGYLGFGILAQRGRAHGPGGAGRSGHRQRFQQRPRHRRACASSSSILMSCCTRRPRPTSPAATCVRRELLAVLIRYYQLHLAGLGEIKSLEILGQSAGVPAGSTQRGGVVGARHPLQF